MNVETLTLQVHADFTKLIASDTGNLVHGSLPFLKFLAQATGSKATILVARENQDITGILPFFILERPGLGSVINSSPWYGSHGGCFLDRSAPWASDTRKCLIEHFVQQIQRDDLLSASLVMLPDEMDHIDIYRDIFKPDVEDIRCGQWTILPEIPDQDALLKKFHQKTRNLVRKSLRQNLFEFVKDEDSTWDYLIRIHTDNMEAVGAPPKPAAHFRALRKMLPPEARRLSMACLNGKPVAALLLLLHEETVEYFVPAVEKGYRPLQPLSFLIFHGMMEAINQGRKFWNWGGTGRMQTSLHHFKAGFGGFDRPYHYLTRAPSNGLEKMREEKENLSSEFPYFYFYPYNEL